MVFTATQLYYTGYTARFGRKHTTTLQIITIICCFNALWLSLGVSSLAYYVFMAKEYDLRLLETVHVALCIHVLYEYLIVAWGNLLASARIVPSVSISGGPCCCTRRTNPDLLVHSTVTVRPMSPRHVFLLTRDSSGLDLHRGKPSISILFIMTPMVLIIRLTGDHHITRSSVSPLFALPILQ